MVFGEIMMIAVRYYNKRRKKYRMTHKVNYLNLRRSELRYQSSNVHGPYGAGGLCGRWGL